VDASAKLTSKGQITVPKAVRDALDLHTGDELLFRVERTRAVLAKTPDFIEMAGSVTTPAGMRGTSWDEVLRQTYRMQAEQRS
jgi:antitoxin PrlF